MKKRNFLLIGAVLSGALLLSLRLAAEAPEGKALKSGKTKTVSKPEKKSPIVKKSGVQNSAPQTSPKAPPPSLAPTPGSANATTGNTLGAQETKANSSPLPSVDPNILEIPVNAIMPGGSPSEGFQEELIDVSVKWKGEVPPEAGDVQVWTSLLKIFMERGDYFSALATAQRMLVFFNDLPTKELAYRTVISLIDRGYPFPTLNIFLSGDIEPQSDPSFTNSYNFYKGILNRQLGMEKWAQNYFKNIDRDNFPKYLFYQALNSYSSGNLAKAEAEVQKILKTDFKKDQIHFVKRLARTLARIYFDQKKYSESLDVYQNFLLKLNPVEPRDWIEAAWNLFYLKRYPEALGYLYNLEDDKLESYDLEKYSIRALIYRNLCAADYLENLTKAFDARFGSAITALKRGESIAGVEELRHLNIPGNTPYLQLLTTVEILQDESSRLGKLSPEQKAVATYLYDSEIAKLTPQMKALETAAFERIASHIATLSEQLRFIKFDIARGKFNPEAVFQSADPETALVVDLKEDRYQIRWRQHGDYWRDERLSYQGVLKDRCVE